MKMKSERAIWLTVRFGGGKETSGATDDVIQEQFCMRYMVSRKSEGVYTVGHLVAWNKSVCYVKDADIKAA
jgi:hypothetical protein